MNSQTHRLIFNAARGCIMAVAETSRSSGKCSAYGAIRSTPRRCTSSFYSAGIYASNRPLEPIEYARAAPDLVVNRSYSPSNTTIRATGDGQNSNLTLQGSSVQSGTTTTLAADNQVQLLAAANTASQTSSQSSSSSSVGVSAGKSTGVTVSAAQGSGDGNGQDVFYTNTQIGGKTVNLQSGGDTTLKGAVVKADTVNASVGGKLQIESLQDTSNYTEQSKNAGGSVTVGPAPGASINLGKSNIDSSYASVTEQSGIRAGDGGFNVKVQGNTELKGGAITSTQKAIDDNKNSFQSASLTTSDIQNSASYKADSAQINAGVGSSVGGSAGIGNQEGSAASTTQAAISGIAGNKAARTGDAETGIAKIFDADAVRKDVNAQVAITKEFGQQATKVGAQYAQDQLNKANALKALADLEADSDAKQKLLSQASDLEGNWKEGGPMRVLMHAGIGLLTGGAEGAAGAAASATTTPQISDMLADTNLPDAVKQGLLQATGAAIGALAGGSAGAATGLNEVSNNALGTVIKRVGIPALVACLKTESCRTMTGVVGAALAVQAAKIMQENPGLSESDAFSLAIVDYGASVLTGKPATPLPPAAPTITPADARKIYGTPPLNDPEQLRAWLGQALQGYPADEAEKWAKDLIRTLPAAEQQKYSDLITQQVHHICTDKNCISPNTGGLWTPEFKKMFDKAGLSMQDDLNQVWVAGHKGPHPQEYHALVYDRLKGLDSLPADAYQQAFKDELAKIGQEVQTPGTRLNKLVTKK